MSVGTKEIKVGDTIFVRRKKDISAREGIVVGVYPRFVTVEFSVSKFFADEKWSESFLLHDVEHSIDAEYNQG